MLSAAAPMGRLNPKDRNEAVSFFESVQKRLCALLERVDGAAHFEKKGWDRPDGGGGSMAVLRGPVVEKAGVNVSSVYGDRYPALESEYANKPFFASGVSTITHMRNPFAPIGHMNVRILEVEQSTFWFGGGADLTPFHPYEEDTRAFHERLKKACKLYSDDAYALFSKQCDEYFYIPHRRSVRGVGGIFFDYLRGPFKRLFPFVQDTAEAYLEAYPAILERRKAEAYSLEDKDKQLYWRGRYVEFNLVYDRGTKFGLLTGGNTEAIFVSLPPEVKW